MDQNDLPMIETGIPIPPRAAGPGRKTQSLLALALDKLCAGNIMDSMFLPDSLHTTLSGGTPKGMFSSHISRSANSRMGKGVVVLRREPGGIRVWKVAEPTK